MANRTNIKPSEITSDELDRVAEHNKNAGRSWNSFYCSAKELGYGPVDADEIDSQLRRRLI